MWTEHESDSEDEVIAEFDVCLGGAIKDSIHLL